MTTELDLRVDEVHDVDADLRERLLDVWTAVTDAGGAVGFVPPADRGAHAQRLDEALAEVRAGRRLLAVLFDGDDAVGFGYVVPQSGPVVGHRGTVLSLQVDPARQGQGLGRRLLAGLHDVARAHGLTQLTLYVRSGQGLEPFYTAMGYREVGRWERTLRVGTEWRDDVWFATDL